MGNFQFSCGAFATLYKPAAGAEQLVQADRSPRRVYAHPPRARTGDPLALRHDRSLHPDKEIDARVRAFFDCSSFMLVCLNADTIRAIKTSRESVGGDRHDEGQRLSGFVCDNAAKRGAFSNPVAPTT